MLTSTRTLLSTKYSSGTRFAAPRSKVVSDTLDLEHLVSQRRHRGVDLEGGLTMNEALGNACLTVGPVRCSDKSGRLPCIDPSCAVFPPRNAWRVPSRTPRLSATAPWISKVDLPQTCVRGALRARVRVYSRLRVDAGGARMSRLLPLFLCRRGQHHRSDCGGAEARAACEARPQGPH